MLPAPLRKLASIERSAPAPEVWAYLRTRGRSVDEKLKQAITRGTLTGVPLPAWATHTEALRRFFGHHPLHSFGVARHEWLSLIETQATGGLAHFIAQGSAARARARFTALLAACGGPDLDPDDPVRVAAFPEERLQKAGRLDLFGYARGRDGRDHLLILEGKFGHEVGPGQLQKYEKALQALADAHGLRLDGGTTTLVLVGGRLTSKRRAALSGNVSWQFRTWRELVLALDRRLTGDDDEEFRRFRRTLWERGG